MKPPEEPAPAVRPFYYLDNFSTVLDWVSQRHADLLDEEERAFIAAFRSLPQPARALLVRMIMRSGPLLRESRLDYAEIGPMAAAVAPLVAAGMVDDAPAFGIDALFGLLTKPELAQLFPLGKGMRKAAQLESLRAQHGAEQVFAAWAPGSGERIFRLRVDTVCERLRILFFGNAHQDWSEFVLADLGIFRYEKVALAPDARAFRTRADLDHYLALIDARRRLEEGAAIDAVLGALPPAPQANPWLLSRHERLRFAIAQQLEKAGEQAAALALYRDSAFRGARQRAVRMLELLGETDAAWALAQAAHAAPEDAAESQAIARMLPRLARAAGMPAPARAPKPAIEESLLELPAPREDYWVEEEVRRHFHREDAPAFYVENALANSLFGLLCWDAIFMELPGAFFHPFQAGPADLHAGDFHARRREAFDACLAALDDGSWRERILATWRAKAGTVSPFVSWDVMDEDLLMLALDCIPPAHLRLWSERILADIRANRSGFPDLVQFFPEERSYRLVEVKGPGDRLQDNQRRLLGACVDAGVPVLVCHVRWVDA